MLIEANINNDLFITGLPHCAEEDTTLQGFTIPKGTTIFPNIWAVHHDQDLWIDPEVFRPERFLNDEGAVIQPEYYIPFSTGKYDKEHVFHRGWIFFKMH